MPMAAEKEYNLAADKAIAENIIVDKLAAGGDAVDRLAAITVEERNKMAAEKDAAVSGDKLAADKAESDSELSDAPDALVDPETAPATVESRTTRVRAIKKRTTYLLR